MKSKSLVILSTLALALVVACWVGPAAANTWTYNTPMEATVNGSPVNAQATVTTSDYSALNPYNVEIVLTNNLANPTNIAQCLSDFAFDLTNFAQTSGAISESSSLGGATPITVASDGTYTLGTPISGTSGLGWTFSQTSPNGTPGNFASFLLSVLGNAGPANLIIGGQNTSDNKYDKANGSIAGNDPHNPLLYETATFYLYVPGVDSDTGIGNVAFSFGTTIGSEITVVPIPPAALLLGSGLLGLVGFRRFKKS